MPGGDLSLWSIGAAVVLALLGVAVVAAALVVAWRLGRAAGRGRGRGGGAPAGAVAAAVRLREARVLDRGFAAALGRVRRLLRGPGWRYAASWVLLLGGGRAGRSTLAEAIALGRPIRMPDDPEQAVEGCVWHVFEPGIVLEPAEAVLGRADDPTGLPSPRWRRLLRLLRRHRRERAIDGVVVTVACPGLMAPVPAPETERAGLLRRCLRDLQQELGLRVPVYLVVTKCDAVPGFAAFWRPHAAERGQQMFGWSNDETPQTSFGAHLIRRAFDALADDLNRILLGQAVRDDGIADQAFLFPAEFQTLAGPVGRFADLVFRVDAYQDPHFFRGVWFTGDVPADPDADPVSAPPVASAPWRDPQLAPAGPGAPAVLAAPDPAPADPAASSDPGAPVPAAPAAPEGSPVGVELDPPPPPRVLFATDLFAAKVFREGPLVQPARPGMVARSLPVRLRWAALALLALILALGAWTSYRTVQTSASKAVALFREIVAQDFEFTQQRKLIPPLLEMFSTISDRGLVRPFLPASWFSGIERDVKRGLSEAFSLVLLFPMWPALANRTNTVLKSPDTLPVATTPAEALQAIAGFVDRLGTTAELADQYNRADKDRTDDQLTVEELTALVRALDEVRSGPSALADPTLYADQVTELVQALEEGGQGDPPTLDPTRYADEIVALIRTPTRIDVGPILASDPDLFAEIMKRVNVIGFEPAWFARDAQAVLDRLVDAAAGLVRTGGGAIHRFQTLADQLRTTGTPRGADLLTAADRLGALNRELVAAKAVISAGAFEWRFVNTPEDSPGWRRLIDGIRANPFLGHRAAARTRATLLAEFAAVRIALLAIEVPAVGPLLIADDTADGRLRLAPPVEALAQALPAILAYGVFRARARRPPPPAPALNELLWALEPLDRAVAYETQFVEIEGGPLAQVPTALRPMIREAASQALEGAMLGAVAEAEVLEPRGAGFRRFDNDAALLREARQFGRAAVAFGNILETFKKRGFDRSYATVSDLIRRHALAMLDQADHLVEQTGGWLPVDGFETWDGVLPMNFEGYRVLGDDELDHFLKVRAARVEWLAMEIAKPIVGGLEGDAVPRALRRHPRVVRWRQIIEELERYQASNPASTLAALERFIRVDLAAFEPGACDGPDPAAGGAGDRFDYFFTQLQTVRRLAVARCRRVAGALGQTAFDRIAQDFNASLAGRYPFADGTVAGTLEVSPDAVVAFFERFTPAVEQEIRRGLGRPSADSRATAALRFLDQIAEVRAFMAPLMHASTLAPPAFQVEAAFRVNRAREVGGNQIIAWTLALGDQSLRRGSEATTAAWVPGAPVTLTLRWAKDAPVVPAAVVGPDGRIDADRTLVLSYGGQWGLIRMIQNNRAPAIDLPRLADPEPETLKIGAYTVTVPVPGAPTDLLLPLTGRTEVFVRLSVLAPTPDGATRTVVPLPVFPFAAPRLETAS